MNKSGVPGVATVAINVKGGDLLFVDHQDLSQLDQRDRCMWAAAGVDVNARPFNRVIVYVPLADDGLNRNSLRTNPKADQPGYSETREFALGIADLWPFLGLFFDDRSVPASNLLAEVYEHFVDSGTKFTYAEVLRFFKGTLLKPQDQRDPAWHQHGLGTIRAVYQRLHALSATLGGLIDATGTGFGLGGLADLQPFDMVVVDIERIMANPRDAGVAESAIKIITAYVLNRLTAAMTLGQAKVDHIIVFADELNRLAPRDGDGGIGEYLAQIARTTRDRGIVLFGAGQFRSGINEDILKAASVHYSMQTPEYELSDRIYAALSPEVKGRLTQLKAGETLLQYPALRTAVFASFPRPFVFTGAGRWLQELAPVPPRPLADCVWERLCRLDPTRPPHREEVSQLIAGLPSGKDFKQEEQRRDVVAILRELEMARATGEQSTKSPWGQFSYLVKERLGGTASNTTEHAQLHTPPGFVNNTEDWNE
jgi:hypothetical protein